MHSNAAQAIAIPKKANIIRICMYMTRRKKNCSVVLKRCRICTKTICVHVFFYHNRFLCIFWILGGQMKVRAKKSAVRCVDIWLQTNSMGMFCWIFSICRRHLHCQLGPNVSNRLPHSNSIDMPIVFFSVRSSSFLLCSCTKTDNHLPAFFLHLFRCAEIFFHGKW